MLRVHVADRLTPLADELASVLATPAGDVMAREWVAVPSAGMRRWLQLQMAARLGASTPAFGDGVVANVDMPFPGSLRTAVLDGAGGADDVPDPWRVERLVWSVLEVADRHVGHAALRGVNEVSQGRPRYGNARKVADLFDRYHVHRPEMIRHWLAGRDVDGVGGPLPSHHRWQAELWQLVRDHLGRPSPPERMPQLLERIREGSLPLDLPDRLCVFGVATLPGGTGFVELVNALGAHRDVHMFVIAPSLRLERDDGRDPRSGPRLRSEAPSTSTRHPLVGSWGRLHRETALMLGDARWVLHDVDQPSGSGSETARQQRSVLAQVQHHVRTNTHPRDGASVDGVDRSVEFHACHGRTRQVEVLRDTVLHLLADDSSLREDDIVVLCPSLERFAPTIEAVFGPSADRSRALRRDTDGRAPSLRYRIADRSIGSTNPMLSAMSAVLDLSVGRFDATSVLDVCALGPVRHRYRFSDDDLATITDWAEEANVRWGLDGAHRTSHGFADDDPANTWHAALGRVLLGIAVDEDDLALTIGDTAPLGIEGDAAQLAGRFADLMWNLGELARATETPRTIAEWSALLCAMADALFATTPADSWQIDTLRRLLTEPAADAMTADQACPCLLSFADVRRLFAGRLADEPGRPAFLVGGLTITSMTPMRWVPHRVVILLGMDQAEFTTRPASGDDLIAAEPIAGDGDPRAESRQALLEAVLSATERLIVIRDGHDVRTNQEVPRAVVVAELVEAVAATVNDPTRAAYLDQLEIRHPRQPFDERCFHSSGDGGDPPGRTGPWSFDPAALAGAVARRERTFDPPTFLRTPLAADDTSTIELADLHAFLKNPLRFFAERRLGLRIPRRNEGIPTQLPTALGGLDGWAVGNRRLVALLTGISPDRWERFERRLGSAPRGVLGDSALAEITTNVDNLLEVAREIGVQFDRSDLYEIDLRLPDGTTIVGTVTCRLAPPARGPARVEYTSKKSNHTLSSWLDLMALEASDPTQPWRAVSVNRGGKSNGREKDPTVVDLVSTAAGAAPTVRREVAVKAIEVAVDCFRRGQREPVPLFPILSPKLVDGTAKADDWQSYTGFSGDLDDVATAMAYGHLEFEELLELERRSDDPVGSERRAHCFATHLWGAITESSCCPADPTDGGESR